MGVDRIAEDLERVVMTNPYLRQRSYTTRKGSVNLTYTFNLTTVMMTCNGACIQSSCPQIHRDGLGFSSILESSTIRASNMQTRHSKALS